MNQTAEKNLANMGFAASQGCLRCPLDALIDATDVLAIVSVVYVSEKTQKDSFSLFRKGGGGKPKVKLIFNFVGLF